MEASRLGSIQDVTLLVDTLRDLRAQLQSYESICQQTILSLKSGVPIAKILQSVEASDARTRLNSGLEELESVRHRSRLSIIAAEIDEGSSISDVGRQWGFSRQMAQRYVKEARTGSWTATHMSIPSESDPACFRRVEDVETARVHRRPDSRSNAEVSGREVRDRDQSGHSVG